MVSVFLTIDVEVWPTSWWDLEPKKFREDFKRYIYGSTRKGEYGLPYQLKLLNEYNLKAVFLVETLFAYEFGVSWLKEIVKLIQDAGQEVQMHIHPEWISRMTHSMLPGKNARRLMDFSLEDQIFIIKKGKQILLEAGAKSVVAFRAGGYGANLNTLKALSKNGISFDSSCNPCIYGDEGGIIPDDLNCQPLQKYKISEFPVSVFQDYPGHLRHAQLGACSFSELSCILNQADLFGWEHFVIVSHGFELLNKTKNRPDPIVVRRFEKLLRFLDQNQYKFKTNFFSDLNPQKINFKNNHNLPLKSNPIRTLCRHSEQAVRRVFR